MAESEKRKAEMEIEDLKKQLKKKMEDDNERLFQALQRQETLRNQSQYDNGQFDMKKKRNNNDSRKQKGYENNDSIEVLRPDRNEKLVSKKYIPSSQDQLGYQDGKNNRRRLEESNVSENDGLQSLHGDSKKIPVNLPN